MSSIIWQQNEHIYTAIIAGWRASIFENLASESYSARDESLDGDSVYVWEMFPDFETSEWWVLSSIVESELTRASPQAYQEMRATIDLCKTKLEALPTHPSHYQRLDYILHHVMTGETHEQTIFEESMDRIRHSTQLHDINVMPFDWRQLNATDWFVDTRHGRAIIRELRPDTRSRWSAPSITHTAWIEHASGAIYEWMTSSVDFMTADVWVHQVLQELDDPRIAKHLRGNIVFTLNICLRVLDGEQDPLLAARIAYIKNRLEEALE